MKFYILVLVLLSGYVNTFSQTTFEYLYSTPYNEFSYCLAEDGEGNIFIPIINYQYALIIKLDSEGSFLDSLNIYNSEGTCRIEYLIKIDDEHFGALGNWYTDSTAEFWYILLDNNLQILEDNRINSNNSHITDFQAIINFRGNILFTASYIPPAPASSNVCMYELTTTGEVINNHFFFSQSTIIISCALLENEIESQYKVIATGKLDTTQNRIGTWINVVDTNLNYIGSSGVQNGLIRPRTSAKWLNDSIYLIAGRWFQFARSDYDMGIIKLTRNDSVLSTASFGKVDTVDWSGNYKCIDFISCNNIFFCGANNAVQPYFQGAPSWIMVNVLNSDLNLINQEFYGGDAYYNVLSVLATQDSGCVISCTRYDYLNQPDDYDAYFLKVNKDGLLVSIPENPIIINEPCIIYPNPGSDAFHVNSSTENLLLQLFDMTGKLKLEIPIEKGDNQVQIPGLPSGIFLYRIFDSKNQLIQAGNWLKQR